MLTRLTEISFLQGCDQYTLTREQLRQKQDKRERTREYQVNEACHCVITCCQCCLQIVSSYSGYWFPLSQGCGVCCHPPCTDEPRIRLAPGDTVRVTRWKRYWLYGELDQGDTGKVSSGQNTAHCVQGNVSESSQRLVPEAVRCRGR